MRVISRDKVILKATNTMNNILLTTCTIILLFTSSCKKDVFSQNIDLNQVQYKIEIPDYRNSPEIKYSDLFQKVEYIQLEANCNDAIIGAIVGTEITNNNDIIVLDIVNYKILRFDSQGHYMNKIGERGHGHSEYVTPLSITYDKYKDQVLVWDYSTIRLLYYRPDGTFIKSEKMPWNFQNFKVLDKEHLIGFFNYHYQEYNYLITDMKGNASSKFEEVKRNYNESWSGAESQFAFSYAEGEDILCRSKYSSIVYRIHNGEVSPFIEFIPKEGNWKMGRPEDLQKIQKMKGNFPILRQTFILNGKLYLIGFNPSARKEIVLCNDLHGNAIGGLGVINDLGGYMTFGLYVQHKNDKVFFLTDPEKYKELLDSWGNRTDIPQKDREFVTQMANSINPIIQVCTVKD